MTTNAPQINLNITFRNTQPTDALRSYAEEKLKHCLKKFIHRDTEAHLVLAVEKNRQIAEVSLRNEGADFNSREESTDLYSSIDALVDSLTKQLRKHKEKIKQHH